MGNLSVCIIAKLLAKITSAGSVENNWAGHSIEMQNYMFCHFLLYDGISIAIMHTFYPALDNRILLLLASTKPERPDSCSRSQVCQFKNLKKKNYTIICTMANLTDNQIFNKFMIS